MTADTEAVSPHSTSSASSAAQLAALRSVLLGTEYRDLLLLKEQMQNAESRSAHVAEVISEAFALRNGKDASLSEAMSPTIEKSLIGSVERDPTRLADALYPVMGPAIRKSIHEALGQTLETFNQLLEQSLSPRSLGWRFDAWRTGRKYSEVVLIKTLLYQVDQVFLIHRETGLLLQHVVSPQAISKDPDMVSGMLTAIQDFVRDSFEVEGDESLSSMRLGKLTVMIDQGPHAVLAAAVHGNPPTSLQTLLSDTQQDIHLQMRHSLQNYEGDSEPFVRIRPLLERCLTGQTQEKKQRKPWLALLVLAGLLAGLGYWTYLQYQERQQWQAILSTLQAEPGLVVIDTEKVSGGYRIEGLRDPLAREPGQVLPAAVVGDATLDFAFKPYLAMEPDMVLQRAKHMLQPPADVELTLQEGVLKVSGQVDVGWQQQLETRWPLVAGLAQLDSTGLSVTDPDAGLALAEQQRLQAEKSRLQAEQGQREADMQALRQRIEAGRFEFPSGSSLLVGAEGYVAPMGKNIRELLQKVRQSGQMLQITISGQADASGDAATNRKLARERAEHMRDALIGQGVPAAILFAGSPAGSPESSSLDERSVRYTVELY